MLGASNSLPPKVLVVGGDSLIGSGLVEHFRSQGTSVGYTSRRPNHEAPACIPLELGKAIALPYIPEVAILCAGVTDFRSCAEQPDATRRINVDAVLELAATLHLCGAHILYLSSNAVCEIGKDSVQSHSLPPITTELGAQKHDAECGILALGERATVVRAAKVVSCKASLIASWLNRLSNDQTITPLSDYCLSPVSLQFMVTATAQLAFAGASGIFNISGAQTLSYSDFAYQLAAAMNVNIGLINPKNSLDLNFPSYYPRTLKSLGMLAMISPSGILPQSVRSVIVDLLVEFSIEQSSTNHAYPTLSEKR